MGKALKAGVPVFISECGAMSADGSGEINEEEFGKWIDLAESYNIAEIFWSIADKEEICSMLKPNTNPYLPLKDHDITEWGLFVKKYLLEHNK